MSMTNAGSKFVYLVKVFSNCQTTLNSENPEMQATLRAGASPYLHIKSIGDISQSRAP